MEKSHSGCPRTAWCVVNVFHKNGMSPLIITNSTICYSILRCYLPALYIKWRYMYSVISVKLYWLLGNTKKWTIDLFVAFEVRFLHSWAERNTTKHTSIFVCFFWFGIQQLSCREQPERAQVEAQYWGNPKVARLEGTPAILFWGRHSHTQIYIQTRNRTQQTWTQQTFVIAI